MIVFLNHWASERHLSETLQRMGFDLIDIGYAWTQHFNTASLLSDELLWKTHPMGGINDGLLASCQVCSLPHIESN